MHAEWLHICNESYILVEPKIRNVAEIILNHEYSFLQKVVCRIECILFSCRKSLT
jgi:hypothetical protein